MRRTKFAVVLADEQRAQLRALVGCGVAPARRLTHARILLKADQGEGGAAWSDVAIAGVLEVHPATVARVRQQCVEEGLEAALDRRAPRREYPRKLDGELVRLEVVDAVSHETVAGPCSKRPEAVAAGAVVHPARGGRRVRVADGGCAVSLHPTPRPGTPGRLPGRD